MLEGYSSRDDRLQEEAGADLDPALLLGSLF